MFHLSRKWMRCSSEVIWFFFQTPFFFCHLPCNNTTVGILHLKHGSWDDKCSNDSVNSFPWNFLKEYQYISNIRDYSVPWTVPKMCHQRCGTAKQAAGTSPELTDPLACKAFCQPAFFWAVTCMSVAKTSKEIRCASLKAKWRKRQVLSWRFKSWEGDYINRTMANIVIKNKGLYTWNPNDL